MRTESMPANSATDPSTAARFDALLIIGHGTRDPAGLAEFRLFVERVTQHRTDWHVAGCFLELAEPSIAKAVDELAERGKSRIRAMPLMLFAAGHAKRDIPDALTQAAARNPGVEIELCPPFGCHQAILEVSAERYHAAADTQPAVPPDETLLVLIGRGSSDFEATTQMRKLAELRQAPHVEVGFVAVAKPSLGEVLEKAAQSHFRRVIVQPHLLFGGDVLTQIHRQVERQRLAENARSTVPGRWVVTDALGPDLRLVTAVVDLVSAFTPRANGE